MAPPRSGILQLSNELLREVLDHIESDPEKLVNLDRRAYLSQESFRPPPAPSRNQAKDIANFRLACKRFSELGAIHQFARVTTRFSRHGFRRLENIAKQSHLAKHVRKFSYMVPCFYVEGRERVHDIIQSFSQSLGSLDVRNFDRKVRDQKELVGSGEDARILSKAFSAFTSLQHVQILRVQDYEDGLLLGYLRQHQELANLVELKWAPACSHSTKTLGAALLDSQSPCSRFSSPMLSPQSAEVLAAHMPMTTFKLLAHRLTSLELHFDDGVDLDKKMLGLSKLFQTLFTAAENMQAIHIGFPSHRPLTLPLEDLFHGVKWERLAAFGIQGWKLNADEIIGLVGRHREKLRGLRLRDVLLKEQSMWKDVLEYLRDEVPRLDWVSLRRIGYAKHFDDQWAEAGVEVPDDPPGGESDSDIESFNGFEDDPLADDGARDSGQDDDDDDDDNNDDNATSHENSRRYLIGRAGRGNDSESDTDSITHSNEGYEDDDDNDDNDDDDDDNHGNPIRDGMDFPPLSPGTPSSAPWCQCNVRDHGLLGSAEDLGDNGVFVSNQQRKAWEKWVVRRCFNADHGKHYHHHLDASSSPQTSPAAPPGPATSTTSSHQQQQQQRLNAPIQRRPSQQQAQQQQQQQPTSTDSGSESDSEDAASSTS